MVDFEKRKKSEPLPTAKSEKANTRDIVKKQYMILRKIEYFEGIIEHLSQHKAGDKDNPIEQKVQVIFQEIQFTFPEYPDAGLFTLDKRPFVLAIEAIKASFLNHVEELESQLEKIK